MSDELFSEKYVWKVDRELLEKQIQTPKKHLPEASPYDLQIFEDYSKCLGAFWTIFGHMKALGFPELPIQLRDRNSKE